MLSLWFSKEFPALLSSSPSPSTCSGAREVVDGASEANSSKTSDTAGTEKLCPSSSVSAMRPHSSGLYSSEPLDFHSPWQFLPTRLLTRTTSCCRASLHGWLALQCSAFA